VYKIVIFAKKLNFMAISWNEIKSRAISFSKDWEDAHSETSHSQTFWNEFFNIFGISTRRVGLFEQFIRADDGSPRYIDFLWKGVILIEHKSLGRSLESAYQQAMEYCSRLKEHELPKYILVCDFQQFVLYNLEENTKNKFALADLLINVGLFGFLAGYEKRIYREQDPANIEAAKRMGELHDALKDSGYMGHALEVYLVRLLFCLFAEDTSIFERALFQEYIDKKTNVDGSDLSMHLAHLFQVLNTPKEKRLKNLDENLAAFPYVNGRLFEEVLPIAAFDSEMRNMLLYACSLDWSKISPAIFGSMFQSVMNPIERRNLGAHYTSEENIQKVINPLFLEDLHKEFEKVKGNAKRLDIFHQKIGNLRFLDPACGCGNFLIIAYRELRELELLVLKELRKVNPKEYGNNFLNIKDILKVNIDQFYGIEYDEFPARIAEVAMYLIEHQMNMKVQLEFGNYINSLPLTASANIVHGNALKVDWTTLLNGLKTLRLETEAAEILVRRIEEPAEKYKKVQLIVDNYKVVETFSEEKEVAYFDYILGNPPFIGKQMQNAEQKEEISRHFQGISGYGVLDYVTTWYLKAARFIQNTQTKVAFVSTNSIAQGEQVSILWNELFHRYK
jgi:type I restriction-modification system DNA methylase subunit